jgi:hypothetical protein
MSVVTTIVSSSSSNEGEVPRASHAAHSEDMCSSSASSKTWRAPLRSPSSAVIELRPARGLAAPRQKAHGSMVELPAGMRQRPVPPTAVDRYGHDIVFGHEPSLMMHAVRRPARGKSAAEMQTRRNAGPSSRLWVSSVPTIVDALGLGEAGVSAKGSGAT